MNSDDQGAKPYVVNIEDITKENAAFRKAQWTGKYFQLTLMSIPVGGEVGLEVHPDTDQFLRLEKGHVKVLMGQFENNLDQEFEAESDFAIIVPAGTWHNIINVGDKDVKLYSIYAPPHHPFGTVHETYADAMAAEAVEAH